MEDYLKRLGYSIARGVPQAATGFVDLAALPFTMSGMIKPEDVFLSTDYLTQKGLLPKPEQGLLNQTTELLSSAISPAAATKAGILATGGLLAGLSADAARLRGADLSPVGSVKVPKGLFHGTDAPEPKDLMFVKNVSPEALQKYDLLGGMPVPSIAVVQKDAPFEGFGDISLIGKPENFDPKQKGNVVYSSDIYSAREPKPFTLATKKADEMFLEDFREAFQVTRKDPRSTGIDTKLQKLQTKKKATGNQFDDVKEWFSNSPEAKIKFLQDQGIKIPDLKDYDSLQMNYLLTEENDSLFRGFKGQSEFDKWSEKQMDKYFQGKKYFEYENPKYAKESARLSEIYNKTNDPNLMEAIDRQFERLERNRQKVAEYTAENITKVMKNMPTIGAEEGLGTSGIGRMRAGLTEKLTSLDDIRANKDLLLKEMYDNKQLTNNEIKREEIVQKLYEKTGADAENVKYMLPNLSSNVNSFLVEAIDKGGKKKDFEKAFKGSQFEKYLDDSLLAEMQDFAEGLRVSPVNYFEAKPQRTVDLSEFAGAVVPRGTAPEIISLLESKGLKVRDYDRFAKKSPYKTNQDRLDQRNTFTNQLFDLGGAGLAGLLGYKLLDDEDEISLGQIRI